ncbi:hypothetical protein DACRYDRAFT_107916 [Dacryopinax primogenitus]|uniref:Uncharacterized protein n=1 Tax=Dacryopinax primogenitus (strain DJM 731) TaxID=1858805 RepID=M5GBI3_DACPD|nr:uncharacterized protein DACRYDRAFT_107916 [Dacryopinax primogenitus]EJU01363.1 hypothetical protein DACRYDRAFT_107916 [Dacryopinax primogenitus]
MSPRLPLSLPSLRHRVLSSPLAQGARRTFLRNPKRDPSVPPTYAELEAEARIGRLRVIVVSLPLVVVCGYILYRRMMLGEEQRRTEWAKLGGTPPGKIGDPLVSEKERGVAKRPEGSA